MNNLKIIFLFPLLFSSLFNAKVALAQETKNPLKCNQNGKTFHSLRPHPGQPCGDPPKALFCGNSLIFSESPRVGPKDCTSKIPETPGGFICSTNITIPKHNLSVKIDSSKLPILGNTEDVVNKNKKTDSSNFDDAEKVNEYASWYLNGVNGRAEYPLLDTSNPQDIQKIIDFSGPIKKLLSWDSQIETRIKTVKQVGKKRSNQLVGCTILGIPVPCYHFAVNEHKLSEWKKHLPPLRKDYKKYSGYYLDYQRWRGKSCLSFNIPFVNKNVILCANNPLKPDYWSNLFSHIPFSSTDDKLGREFVSENKLIFQGEGGTKIKNGENGLPVNANLYFPHTQEVKQLSQLLNKTHIPQGVSPQSIPESIETNNCRTADVRSNSGDSLFPKNPSMITIPNVTYKITQIECNKGATKISCEANINLIAKMAVESPNIKQIWDSTVADSTSTFRKIFPKVEEGAPVSCIADIPATSKTTYTSLKGNLAEIRSPNSDQPTSNPELYFPHIGSVYEYFLKGIQTALRPKGYGEPITNGKGCTNTISNNQKCGEEPPNLPKGSGSCKLGAVSPSVGDIPQSFKDIVEAAAETFKVPPNLILGIMYAEGAFNPGKYNWTDQNVKNWSSCQDLPKCSVGGNVIDSVVPFFNSEWNRLAVSVGPILKQINPAKEKPNPCNLLDATFALAKNLKENQSGSKNFSGRTCFGIPLNFGSASPATCAWNSNSLETAIRMWEFGSKYDSNITCATLPGSCETGGGFAMACPNGDVCEKYTNAGNTSHNACIWNVARGN